MDPLTALSVAGTIIQFVDFGSKLLTHSVELYRSSRGSLKVHDELELVTGDLRSVVIKLKGASEPPPETDRPLTEDERQSEDFRKICDEATRIAEELLNKLSSIRVKDGECRRGKHRKGEHKDDEPPEGKPQDGKIVVKLNWHWDRSERKWQWNGRSCIWESLKTAVKAAWSADEIATLKQRLEVLKGSLHSRAILLLGQKIDAESVRLSSRFDNLDTQSQQILFALLQSKDNRPQDTVDSIAKMLCRLEAVNQSEHHKTRVAIMNMVLANSNDQKIRNSAFINPPTLDDITAQIEMLNVEDEEEQRFRRSIQKTILEALRYANMTERYEDLVEAHPQTFGWVFCDPNKEQLPWYDFGQWLRKEEGIYWINGKPGSGKSTLMKHIFEEPRTRQFLQEWSSKGQTIGDCAPVPYCIASFFFWNSGTSMQQSSQGLLRSLLFQVLGKHPELIPVAFPTRWAALYTGNSDLGQQIQGESFSLRQLHDAFEKIVEQKQIPLRICFLIDGLDEFSGDTEQLCMLFKRSAGRSDTVKFCLSSRPWAEFQRTLSGCASLRLQDLTSNDIKKFVADKFQESPAFMRVAARHKELASTLMAGIQERAEGVFLWVEVVVRLLLRGAAQEDTIPELWTLLESLPRELYPLFDRILSEIDSRHRDWAARAFQVMRLSGRLLSDPFAKLSTSSSQRKFGHGSDLEDVGVSPPTMIEMLLAVDWEDLRGLQKTPAISSSTMASDLKSRIEQTEIRLTARCAGLLEVSIAQSTDDPTESHNSSMRHIRWMHRTARDFIHKDTKWTKILDALDLEMPSGYLTLMRASIVSVSSLVAQQSGPNASTVVSLGKLFEIATNALIFAYQAQGDQATRRERSELLTLLMNAGIWETHETQDIFWRTRKGVRVPLPPGEMLFLQRATLYCLFEFVEDALESKSEVIQRKAADALLDRLCSFSQTITGLFPFVTVEMITSLIKLGNFPKRCIVEEPESLAAPRHHRVWPSVTGSEVANTTTQNLLIDSRASLGFLESRVAAIETFLHADVDPTNTLLHVPRNTAFSRVAMKETLETRLRLILDPDLGANNYFVSKPKLETDSISIVVILDELADVLEEQDRPARKRKHAEVTMSDDDSDDLDGSDDNSDSNGSNDNSDSDDDDVEENGREDEDEEDEDDDDEESEDEDDEDGEVGTTSQDEGYDNGGHNKRIRIS